jgi:hypothetical protein
MIVFLSSYPLTIVGITRLGFKDCKVLVSQVDSQQSQDGGIIIQVRDSFFLRQSQVLGEMSNMGQASRKFCQTFFLAVQTSGYYVLNDIFRYLKEDIVENSFAEEPVVATKASNDFGGQTAPPINSSPYRQEPTNLMGGASAVVSNGVANHGINGVVGKPAKDIFASPYTTPAVPSAAPVAPASIVDQAPVVKEEKKQHIREKSRSKSPVKTQAPPVPSGGEWGDSPVSAAVAPVVKPAAWQKPSVPKATVVETVKPVVAAVVATPPPQPVAPIVPAVPKTWATLAATSSAAAPVAPKQQAPAPAVSQSDAVSDSGSVASSAQSHASRAAGIVEWESNKLGDAEKDRNSVYIKNLAASTTERHLRDALSSAGPIKNVEMLQNKSIAFVEFTNGAQSGVVGRLIAGGAVEVNGARVVPEERKRNIGGGGRNRGGPGGRNGGGGGRRYGGRQGDKGGGEKKQ